MHPDFEHYRDEAKGKGAENTTITARVPAHLKEFIEFLADVEGDGSYAPLVIEGLARVFEDRLSEDGLADLERTIAEKHETGMAQIPAGRELQERLRAARSE